MSADQIQNSSASSLHSIAAIIKYFSTSINSASSVDDILMDIARNIVNHVMLPDVVIYFLDPTTQKLVQKFGYGYKNPSGGFVQNPISIQWGDGIVGSVAESGKAEIINDIEQDNRYISDGFPGKSEITVPILVDGRVIGIIDSEHADLNYFTNGHLEVLTAIAELCANRIKELQSNDFWSFLGIKNSPALELFNLIQSSEGIGFWIYDVYENRMNWSDKVYEIFETDKSDELEPGHFFRKIHHDDFKAVNEALNHSIKSGEAGSISFRLLFADKSTKTVQIHYQPAIDVSDKVGIIKGTVKMTE